MANDDLLMAAEEFVRAQSSCRNKNYRVRIQKLLQKVWLETTNSKKPIDGVVQIKASALYTLLHQAMQTLPGGD